MALSSKEKGVALLNSVGGVANLGWCVAKGVRGSRFDSRPGILEGPFADRQR